MKMGNWTWKKIVMVSALGVAALTALSYGGYSIWLNTPPAMPSTPEEALKVLNSRRFEHLPEYRKKEYLAQASKLVSSLDNEQRRAFFEAARATPEMRETLQEVGQQMRVQRAVEFARATPEERTKLLDAQIDQMQSGGGRGMGMGMGGGNRGPRPAGGDRPRRPAGEGNNAGENRPNADQWRNRMQERVQDRLAHGDPQDNALVSEYFRALRQRMQERGIQPRQRNPGARPGPGGQAQQ